MKRESRFVSAKMQTLTEKLVSHCELCGESDIYCEKCNEAILPNEQCFCQGTGIHLCPRCGRYTR